MIEQLADGVIRNAVTNNSTARYRNVIVKLCIVALPMITFLLSVMVRNPASRFYMRITDIAVVFLTSILLVNLDLSHSGAVHTLSTMLKWCVFVLLFALLIHTGIAGTIAVATLQTLSFLRINLVHVEARTWLILILVSVVLPSTARLFSLRDVSFLARLVPTKMGRWAVEIAVVTFFLVQNTFSRRVFSAWDIATSRAPFQKEHGFISRWCFIGTEFVWALIDEMFALVLLTFSLASDRGFRRAPIEIDRYVWRAIGPEDVVACLLLCLLGGAWGFSKLS